MRKKNQNGECYHDTRHFLLNMKNISNIRSLVFAYKRLKT